MTVSHGQGDLQGSLWRRWDPHIHMPGTALSDQYGSATIAEALAVIAEQEPSIEVLGITDYLTTENFRETRNAWLEGPETSIKDLFVNVELRLWIKTQRDVAVNMHLLCAADHVDDLDRFLSGLEFHSLQDRFRAERKDLVRLGRAHKNQPNLPEAAALREGVNQFKVDFKDLRERYETTHWAREHLLIAVPGGEGDGPAGLRDESGSFTLLRQELERFAHIIFSGNPKQQIFWLGQGADGPEKLVHHYGGKKLCLHGSDAHRLEKAGVPELGRYAWLKGDATFETLRQACIAPDTRGHVGQDPPHDPGAHGRITALTVRESPWFPNHTVPLNPGLVAIIGARGSGKTALADLMAIAAGSTELHENELSFIYRARDLLGSATATATWSQGDATTAPLVGPQGDGSPQVRYLSQQFVERLCASEGVTDDLLAEIQRVVFDAWPAEERLGATSFDQLLAIRLNSAVDTQAVESAAISDLSDRITSQRLLIESGPGLLRDKARHEERKLALETEAEALTSKADKQSADRLAAVNAAFDQRSQRAQQAARRVKAIEALENEIRLARSSTFPGIVSRLNEGLESAGVSLDDWENNFTIDFGAGVDKFVANAIRDARSQVIEINGTQPEDAAVEPLDDIDSADLGSLSVGHLNAERERLKRLVGLDDGRTEKLTAITKRTTSEAASIAETELKLKEVEKAPRRRDDFIENRIERYAAYFDALLEEEEELQALYAPLSRVVANAGPTVARLEFSVQRIVDLAQWAEQGERFLDLRTGGAFRGRGGLAEVVREDLQSAWQAGDGQIAAEAIRSFSTNHSKTLREHRRVDGAQTFEQWQRAVNQWMYSAKHVTLSYSLKYDGLDIRSLSPGTRGIVLLLLYLAIDQEETLPLIIDQPEENLDPESIQTDLVGLFQQASARRQIIMVTHNANLVVNTDVDQVIVAQRGPLEADQLPEFTYLSGGLENEEIRTYVCEVLEGGEAAFRERARRLRLGEL